MRVSDLMVAGIHSYCRTCAGNSKKGRPGGEGHVMAVRLSGRNFRWIQGLYQHHIAIEGQHQRVSKVKIERHLAFKND